jgi:multicomponent K+:H+ antiporter subunit F
MLSLALDIALGAVALSTVIVLIRLLRGPDIVDRILALDTMAINAVALVVLLGMRWHTDLLFEAGLILAMLGFVSTVALARQVARGDVIE